ncbi:MAG TPA: methyltransferase domain-containing protein [Vicinamibacteria bacterium]|jgi:SAM-dependent methyltransferase|nr:methyltransferase domain-containing protein [Vicinamibacteria bacterium]
MGGYASQRRGDRGAYERYLAGMDSSMRQKVALTAAHLLAVGRIADMGMGSGAGSEALAALYPRLDVIAVDVDPVMAALARAKYPRENLLFVVADIARAVCRDGTLDAIFDSSVLHHVTSYRGYRRANATDALAVQAAQLTPLGVLIVRDFVDPGPETVLLDLPADDGDDSSDPRTCSTARLFERFAREFRSLSETPGFAFEEVDRAPREGWRRYRLTHTLAAEFVLRKDYRADWESEVKEEYTYLTQDGFEDAFARLGLRVLASTPIRNPWIVRKRFAGRFELRDAAGNTLEFPPTNYLIAGEKIPAGEGVRFREAAAAPPIGFLRVEHHRQVSTGAVRDLVRRPNATVDILPYFEEHGDLIVLARMSYPRPILSAREASAALDGSRAPGYVTEPLNVLQADRPLGDTVEEALAAGAHVAAGAIHGMREGATYYPSPGGILEEVRSVLVEIDPTFVEAPLAGLSGFSTSGRVRALEARQLLRAAQVGGLPDARLELNVYELLLQFGRDPGPWIGEAVTLADVGPPPGATTAAALEARPARRDFARARPAESRSFLEVRCALFEELDASAALVASHPLEFVLPRPLGTNTVATAPLWRHGAEVYLGLDDDDLPAAQSFTGNSALLVAPAWRLPRAIQSTTPARAWVRRRLEEEYGLACGEMWDLGGPYRPSAGLTPEAVYPLAIEVTGWRSRGRPLRWVRLRDAIAARSMLRDGHLRVAALRAAHALGALARAT